MWVAGCIIQTFEGCVRMLMKAWDGVCAVLYLIMLAACFIFTVAVFFVCSVINKFLPERDRTQDKSDYYFRI